MYSEYLLKNRKGNIMYIDRSDSVSSIHCSFRAATFLNVLAKHPWTSWTLCSHDYFNLFSEDFP